MISKIKKRDGTVVDFNVNKLTHWAKWAGVVGADWFSIAADAYKKCPENTTTVELHKAMIDACLDKEDTPHLMMAGRLLIGQIYKESFGGHDKIPSLQQFYLDMVMQGLWEDMNYGALELIELNKVINHKLDLRSPHSVINQITTKYAITDVETHKVLETPQFVWMRMALGVCKDEPEATRIQSVKEYYKDFSTGKINAPTPNIKNLGTLGRGYASCCVFKSNDNAKSLAAGDHIAYAMTCASAGIGGYLETRSKGEGVRKNTIKHAGKLPYYKLLESAVHANLQGGRGGAATVHFNCLDPEIETLLRLRHPTTVAKSRIGGIDYSFGYHPYLAEKAAKNEQWMLVSYKASPELHKAMYSGKDDFYKLYDDYEASKGKRKYVNARELVLEFLRMQLETGRLYEHNTYQMNLNTPFKDTIYSSNLCVAPETKILTKKGYIAIKCLEDQKVCVWNGHEWSDVVVRKTGVGRKLLKVVTDGLRSLECTPEHKFYIRTGYHNAGVKEVTASQLRAGDKLIKFHLPKIDGEMELDYPYENGIFTADGCDTGVGINNQQVILVGEKIKCKENFTLPWKKELNQLSTQDRLVFTTNLLRNKYFVPDSSFSVKSRVAWFSGYIDGDGCVHNNGIQVCSIKKEFLLEVSLMLQTLGIHSNVKVARKAASNVVMPVRFDGSGEGRFCDTKELYVLYVGQQGVQNLLSLGVKVSRLKFTEKWVERECSQFIKITEVLDEGRYDDTYCFTEPKRNMGMFNGILTGQCQEIGLPTEGFTSVEDLYKAEAGSGEIGLCNLAAIVAGRVSENDYKEVTYRALKMIDNVIDIMEYPFANLKYTAQARRSAGVGITNLAHDMATKGLKYDSEEGKAYMHRLAEMHSYWLHKASVRLAKERGKCDWFHKTKYADGWLPIDTCTKYVDNITSQPLLCDWEGLREEIAKYGMRNSVLEAYMPVESSSIAGNTTNSIYPIREPVVVKSSGTNHNVFIAPDWEELKTQYQFAWDVPQKDMIEMYAIFQKFTGQGISADFYRSFKEGEQPRISAKELLELWLYRIKCGMKTVYYTNTAAGVKPIIIDDANCESCKL